MNDELDAAWAHAEQTQREFREWTEENYPQWFTHRKAYENSAKATEHATKVTFYDYDKAKRG